MTISQNEATRLVSVIDYRIEKFMGSTTPIQITYGNVTALGVNEAAVDLGSGTASQNFRLLTGMHVEVGDRVRVAIDPRGYRRIEEVLHPTDYNKLEVDPVRGTIYIGSGTTSAVMGTGGQSLRVNAGGTAMEWYTPASALTPASSVSVQQLFGQASAVGVSTAYARADHAHGTPTLPNTLTLTGTLTATTLTASTDAGLTINGDTNLYRLAANSLKTDDALDVAGTLSVLGNGLELRRTSLPVFIDFTTDGTSDYNWRMLLASGSTDMAVTGAMTMSGRMKAANFQTTVSDVPYSTYMTTTTVSLTTQTSNSVVVSFPAGRFTDAPVVFVTVASAPGGSQKFVARVTSVSTTGCTVLIYTGDQTSQTASVVVNVGAFQMTSASATG